MSALGRRAARLAVRARTIARACALVSLRRDFCPPLRPIAERYALTGFIVRCTGYARQRSGCGHRVGSGTIYRRRLIRRVIRCASALLLRPVRIGRTDRLFRQPPRIAGRLSLAGFRHSCRPRLKLRPAFYFVGTRRADSERVDELSRDVRFSLARVADLHEAHARVGCPHLPGQVRLFAGSGMVDFDGGVCELFSFVRFHGFTLP